MGLMEGLKDYWNSVPASKVVPHIKNHVGNMVKTLSPSTSSEDRKVAAAKWADSTIDGLVGMGPSDIGVGGLMGYVKGANGKLIPHNNPEVMQAYLNNIKNRFADSDVNINSDIKHYPDYSNLKMDFMRDGQKIGESTRRFTPDGVNMEWLGSKLPEGENMGVMKYLYPAEAQFGRVYGGEFDGTFANPTTHAGFLRSNPDAQPNSLKDYLSVTYDGMKSFP